MQLMNGWTKESIGKHLEKNFKGKLEGFYQSDFGNCVVGCFIPEDKYDSSMEGHVASHIIEHYRLQPFMPLSATDMNLWQTFHDSNELNGQLPVSEQIDLLMKKIA